jgi:hypothetical protein
MALSRERKVLQSRRELLKIPWHLQREISKTIRIGGICSRGKPVATVGIHAATFEFGQSVFA